jgi:predicted dehydrogenase
MIARAAAQDTEEKLRLGIVGLGKMGRLHWRTWQRFPDVAITALVDTDPEAARWAKEQGIPFFRNHGELVGRVDAAVIATPAGQHVSCALPLLSAGIHCLVEKPIALTAIDGERLVAAAARHAAMLAVGHSERFNPGVGHVRDASASALKRIEVFRMAPVRLSGSSDADVVQDLMIHDLDWVINLQGQMPSDFQVKDARWLDGCLSYVSCELSFARRVPIMITASRLETASRREVFVHGACGTTRAINLSISPDSPALDPLTLQARAFLDALQGKASAIATGSEALMVTELGERIRTHCEEADVSPLC